MTNLPQATGIGPYRVLFVMATEQEYGARLRELITPLMVGVGPVESAAETATALAELQQASALPDLVCSLGSAGSRRLDHAAVYQVASVAYRDMDASPFGFEKGQTPFLDVPPIVPIATRIPDWPAASLSTGGTVIAGDAYEVIEADMVDMETFAVMRAASHFGVPTIGLRGISDGRDEVSGLEDWTAYLHLVDENLADAIRHMTRAAEEGRFTIAAG